MSISEVENVWPLFLARDKAELFFVRLNGDKMRVNKREKAAGGMTEYFYDLNVLDVDSDVLKSLGLWDNLSQELKDKSVRVDAGDVIEAAKKMEHARKYRRNKYPGVPNEVTCKNCNVVQKMSPGMIVKNAEKIAKEKGIIYTAEDYWAKFVCNKCEPKRRGKAPSHNLPPKVELKCKCGRSVFYPASAALKFATKKGLKIEEYIFGYKCQTCNPTIGRKKGQRVKK